MRTIMESNNAIKTALTKEQAEHAAKCCNEADDESLYVPKLVGGNWYVVSYDRLDMELHGYL